MLDVNNSEQNKSIMNTEKDKLEGEEIIEKDKKYKVQKPNKSEKEEEENTLEESNLVKYSKES